MSQTRADQTADNVVENREQGEIGEREKQEGEQASASSSSQGSKFVYTFNKFFADYILLLKKTSPAIKEALKHHYRSIDNMSTSTIHLDWFKDTVNVEALSAAYEEHVQGKADGSALKSMPLAKGVTAEMLMLPSCKTGQGQDEACKATEGEEASADQQKQQQQNTAAGAAAEKGSFLQVLSYLCLLACLHYLYRENENVSAANAADASESSKQLELLLQKTLMIVPKVQNGQDVGDDVAGILDEDLVQLIDRMIDCETELHEMLHEGNGDASNDHAGTGGGGAEQFAQMLDRFKDSKLGKLASELTDEIDISKLNIENPADMLNFANITNQDSALGSIVNKMSNKIKSGEIRYDELIGEAMGMFQGMDFGSLQNNPMFANIINNMQPPGAQQAQAAPSGRGNAPQQTAKSSSTTARERLRRKLDARNSGNTAYT